MPWPRGPACQGAATTSLAILWQFSVVTSSYCQCRTSSDLNALCLKILWVTGCLTLPLSELLAVVHLQATDIRQTEVIAWYLSLHC